MPSNLVTYAVGAISFALATAFAIKLRDDVTVPTAAALAPPLAITALGLNSSEGVLFLVGPLVAMLVLLLARRSLMEIGTHVALLLAILGVIRMVSPVEVTSSPSVLLLCLVLTFSYSVVELARQKLSARGQARVEEDRKMWWLLQGVLLCACGLTLLVVERMGWPAFVVMAAVLAVTKREFDAFGQSRTAYDQTLRALDRLRERADQERLVNT